MESKLIWLINTPSFNIPRCYTAYPIVIGAPVPSKWESYEHLVSNGIVGIYRDNRFIKN